MNVQQPSRVWGKGTRVYWHGVHPRIQLQGTVVVRSMPGDLRALVIWDGQTHGHWTSRIALARVNAEPCTCAYCASVREQAAP